MKARRIAVGVGVAMVVLNTMPVAAGMTGGAHREMAETGRGGEAGCPAMAGDVTAFGDERPWISFALAHGKELELTADQTKALVAIRDEYQREAIRLTRETRGAEHELKFRYARKPVDLDETERMVRTITDLAADLRLARLRAVERGRQQLSADQQVKLTEITQAMARMHEAFAPRGDTEHEH